LLFAHVVDLGVDFSLEDYLHVRLQLAQPVFDFAHAHLVLDLVEPDCFAVIGLHHLRLLGLVARVVFYKEDCLEPTEAID